MVKKLLSKFWALITVIQNVLLMGACQIIETVPPRDLTVTRMGVIEVRIKAYRKSHGRLPERLSDLPTQKGRDNAITDGWGRDIQYRISGASMVTLSSLGADRKPGGEQKNAEIIVTFDASKDD
jgi:hypothetical protein